MRNRGEVLLLQRGRLVELHELVVEFLVYGIGVRNRLRAKQRRERDRDFARLPVHLGYVDYDL